MLFPPIFTVLRLDCSLTKGKSEFNWRWFSFLVVCKIIVHCIVTSILDLMNSYIELLLEPAIMLDTGHREASKIDMLPGLISHWSDKY